MQMSWKRYNCSPLKSDCMLMVHCHLQVAAALLGSAAHKNPNVRAKVAAHLDACVQQDPHKIRGELHSAQPLTHAAKCLRFPLETHMLLIVFFAQLYRR